MPFCPSCLAEYRRDIQRCAHCDVDLVEEMPTEPPETSLDGAIVYIDAHTPVIIAVSTLEPCREMRNELLQAGIPCMIVADDGDETAELMNMHERFRVVVAEEDLDRVSEQMAGRFQNMVQREGLVDEVAVAEVQDDGAVLCPACGHSAQLVDGECAECGLFLGE